MSTVLQVKERNNAQHSNLTSLRKEGKIPAVVYGTKLSSTSISLNEADFLKTIKEVGRNGVISLDLEGKKYNVILNDYQSDPIKRSIVHLDFLAVDLSQEINATVKVSLTGDAVGVKDGGVMQQPLHELNITAKPNDIPASIEIDVTNLNVAETLLVGDIQGYSNIEINHEKDEVIASILPPKQEAEIDAGEQQDGGTPENVEGREGNEA